MNTKHAGKPKPKIIEMLADKLGEVARWMASHPQPSDLLSICSSILSDDWLVGYGESK